MTTFENTVEPVVVHKIEELAKVIQCSPQDLTAWRSDSKAIAEGPPFDVGDEAVELLKSKRLDRNCIVEGTGFSEVARAIAAQILRRSWVAGLKGNVLEKSSANSHRFDTTAKYTENPVNSAWFAI